MQFSYENDKEQNPESETETAELSVFSEASPPEAVVSPGGKIQIDTKDIIWVTGKRRSGKSHWVKHFLLPKIPVPVLIWDYNWEYTQHVHAVTHGLNFDLTLRRIAYQPIRKREIDFEKFCKKANKLDNYMLVIEEVERYATSYRIPPSLEDIIDTGRHKGIGLICTSRRPRHTSKNTS